MAPVIAIVHLSAPEKNNSAHAFFSSGIDILGGMVDSTSMSWPCVLFLMSATLKGLEVHKSMFGCLCVFCICLGWWI